MDSPCFAPHGVDSERWSMELAKEYGLLTIPDLVKAHGCEAPIELLGSCGAWRDRGDPVSALRIFLFCEAMKVYPPLSVIRWFADAIEAYLKSGGKPSLDVLLGLRQSNGKKPRVAEAKRESEKGMAVLQAYALVHREKISASEASNRVASKFGYKSETIERALTKVRKKYDEQGLAKIFTK